MITLGELFCGAGGFACGGQMAGLKHAWGIDVDPDACNTARRNLDMDVLCQSVADVDWRSMPPVGGVVFGFPCNDFSVVGERKGLNGNFGPLYIHAVHALNAIQPSFFVAENVVGILHNGAFNRILAHLRNAGRGYTVTYALVRMEEHGVPQSRHCVVFMGVHRDLNGLALRLPQPCAKRVNAREALAGISGTPGLNTLPPGGI